jgi:hypothetical protein
VIATGEFDLEFHLGCDYKCIKALYNDGTDNTVQDGPCATYFCAYGHCNICDIHKDKKGRDRTADEVAGSVLGIEMDRVHLCTLHGEMRLVEKLLHNHLQYVWTYKGRSSIQKSERMEEMKAFLSSELGVHSYKMEEDPKAKGKVRKASLAGNNNCKIIL